MTLAYWCGRLVLWFHLELVSSLERGGTLSFSSACHLCNAWVKLPQPSMARFAPQNVMITLTTTVLRSFQPSREAVWKHCWNEHRMLGFAVPFAIGLLSESDLIVPVVLPFCPAAWDLTLYSGLCPKEVAVPTAWEGSSSNGSSFGAKAWSGIDCTSWRIFSSFIVGRGVLSLGPGLQ